MPRVVPSQVISLIDEVFPEAQSRPLKTTADHAPILAGILRLVDDIPPELIQLSGTEYTDLVMGISGLDHMIRTWVARGHGVTPPQKVRRAHPVVLIRRAIARCPDESPSPATAELKFIPDVEYRNNIRNDISAASSALHHGEWKGATVLAGSDLEALLLWAIQQRSRSDVWEAATALIGSVFPPKPEKDPEDWNLYQYVEVAAHLRLISDDSAIQARLARGFRNLIHPGRAARLAQACNRATALSAIAAVEHVVCDLQ